MVIFHESKFLMIQNKFDEIVEKYNLNIETFKWEKLKNKKKVNALKELLEFFFSLILEGSVSIQILIWNVLDSRHDIVGRDDIKNLSMMYYKLIKFFVTNKLYDKETLIIYPDRNNSLNWDNLEKYLLMIIFLRFILKILLNFMIKKFFLRNLILLKIRLYRLQIFLQD